MSDRAYHGVLDQVFASASNGLILFAVAVVGSPSQLGRVALLFTVVAAATGVLRGAVGTPLLLGAAIGPARTRTQVNSSLGVALLTGALLAVAVCASGSVMAGPGVEVVSLGLVLPVVLIEDVARYGAIASGRVGVAALWDGIWCAGSVLLLILTWTIADSLSVLTLIIGWSGLAIAAMLGLMITLRVRPVLTGIRHWLIHHDPTAASEATVGKRQSWGRHRLRYGIDAGLEQVTVLGVLVVATWAIGAAGAAALRGTAALLAPLAVIVTVVPLLAIPKAVRENSSPKIVWNRLAVTAVGMSMLAVLAGLLCRLMPESWGELLLGRSFASVREIVVYTAAEYAVGVWITALSVYLKAQNRSTDALLLKCAYVVAVIVSVAVALAISPRADAVAIGLMCASIVVAGLGLLTVSPWRPGARVSTNIVVEHPAIERTSPA